MKAWLSEAGICYTEIDTTADAAKVEEMKRLAGGTWVFPTIVIGQEVGLGEEGSMDGPLTDCPKLAAFDNQEDTP